MDISAEHIAHALDGRQVSADTWKACCIAHDDKSPSLYITQTSDKVLLHCFAGCSQDEVIGALRDRGLWPDQEHKQPGYDPVAAKEAAQAYAQAYHQDRRRGIPTTPKEQRQYRQAQSVLCSPFSPAEVAEMHLYCLIYEGATKRQGLFTDAEAATYQEYQKVLERKEVPCEW